METINIQIWILLAVIIGLLFAACAVLAILVGKNHNMKRRISDLETQLAEKESAYDEQRLRLMQNQIRPHFIFNMLLAIKQLCVENPKMAADSLQHFSRYLRMNLEAMSQETLVPFSRELECIREYVALELADPASNFQMNYEIEYEDFSLPMLAVQPMVENAIRHGIASKRDEGVITLKTYLEDDQVNILIKDNGTGYGSETRQQAEHRSIGVKNSKERLRLLCNGELSVISTGSGTIVRIQIPWKDHQAELDSRKLKQPESIDAAAD